MGSVIDLAKAREDREPHISGMAVCLACRHEWAAVAPQGTVLMECPKCGCDGHYKAVVYPAGQHWSCTCGNDLFTLSPTEVVCAHCGTGKPIADLSA